MSDISHRRHERGGGEGAGNGPRWTREGTPAGDLPKGESSQLALNSIDLTECKVELDCEDRWSAYKRQQAEQEQTSCNLLAKCRYLDALHEAVTMYDEHNQLNEDLGINCPVFHEEEVLKINTTTIQKRQKMLREKQEETREEVRRVRERSKVLVEEMGQLKTKALNANRWSDPPPTLCLGRRRRWSLC